MLVMLDLSEAFDSVDQAKSNLCSCSNANIGYKVEDYRGLGHIWMDGHVVFKLEVRHLNVFQGGVECHKVLFLDPFYSRCILLRLAAYFRGTVLAIMQYADNIQIYVSFNPNINPK